MKDKRGELVLIFLAAVVTACLLWFLAVQPAHGQSAICSDPRATPHVYYDSDGSSVCWCRTGHNPRPGDQQCGRSSQPSDTPRPATFTPTPSATPTVTPTPSATPTATPALAPRPTATPTPSKGPAEPVVAEKPTAAPAAAKMFAGLQCLPKHSARPVALCDSRSGSGWWLYFLAAGRLRTGPHVPYPADLEGETMPVYLVGIDHPFNGSRVEAVYLPGKRVIRVSAAYANGKPYVFAVDVDNRVEHWNW